jgi:hypothetical protein
MQAGTSPFYSFRSIAELNQMLDLRLEIVSQAESISKFMEKSCALTSNNDRGKISSAAATRYLHDFHRELICGD